MLLRVVFLRQSRRSWLFPILRHLRLRLVRILKYVISALLMAVILWLGVMLMRIPRMMILLVSLVGNFATGCLLLLGIVLAAHHPVLTCLILVLALGTGRTTRYCKHITRIEKEIGEVESKLAFMESRLRR